MKNVKAYSLLVLGSLLTAISVNTFAVSNHLGEGGVPGLTMMSYYLFNIPTAVTSFILNGLLFLLGLKFLKKIILFKTLFVILCNSLFLSLLAPYPYTFTTSILAPLAAGLFMGAGIGIIYQGGGTSAGSTIIAEILNVKFGLSKSAVILATDLLVILPSGLVIGFEKMCLTIISVVVGAKAIAYISEGAKPRKSVLIISPQVTAISSALEKDLARNGTFFTGEGSFSHQNQRVLFVVVEDNEVLTLKKIVHAADPQAFVVVMDAQNVLGTRFAG